MAESFTPIPAQTFTPIRADAVEQPEEEYEGFLQEVGEGIVSGLIAIPQGITELGTSLVDVVFDTYSAERRKLIYQSPVNIFAPLGSSFLL